MLALLYSFEVLLEQLPPVQHSPTIVDYLPIRQQLQVLNALSILIHRVTIVGSFLFIVDFLLMVFEEFIEFGEVCLVHAFMSADSVVWGIPLLGC